MWPSIAKFFDLPSESGPVSQISLAQMMADKKPLWQELVRKHGLKPTPFEEIALWGFADWVWSRNYDWYVALFFFNRVGHLT